MSPNCNLFYLVYLLGYKGFGWECKQLPYSTVSHKELCLKRVCIMKRTDTFVLKINNLLSKLFSYTFSPVFFSNEIQTIYILYVSSLISHSYTISLFFLFFLPFFFYIYLFFPQNTKPNILLYFIYLFGFS